MILSDLAPEKLAAELAGPGIVLRTGPVAARVRSAVPAVVEGLGLLYGDYPLDPPDGFADFHVSVNPPGWLRRYWRPQAMFLLDGAQPFAPLPFDQALPLLEWGLNRAVTAYMNSYLILHAAVIERAGHAVILPGLPGSGKSTLAADLVLSGWRLLSDELTLLSPDSGLVTALARPFSLKNQSIEVIRRRVPDAVFSAPSPDTVKGEVALLKVPSDSVARVGEPARPAWIVFPRYEAGAPTRLTPRPKAETCLDLGNNSFNYSFHGVEGFQCLASIVDSCDCYDFHYSDLDEAGRTFAQLTPPSGTAG